MIAPFLSARGSSDVWIAGGGRWPGDPEASRPSPVACRRAVTALICDVLLSDMCYGRAARQTCALYTLIHTQHFTSSRLRLALGSTDSGLGHRCSSRANVSDRVRGSAHLLVKRVAHRIDSRRLDKDVLFVDCSQYVVSGNLGAAAEHSVSSSSYAMYAGSRIDQHRLTEGGRCASRAAAARQTLNAHPLRRTELLAEPPPHPRHCTAIAVFI